MTGLKNFSALNHSADQAVRRPTIRCVAGIVVTGLLITSTGCSAMRYAKIDAIPVHRVPQEIVGALKKRDFQEISLARLRRDPPPEYRLAPGDLLGIYIEDVLGDAPDAGGQGAAGQGAGQSATDDKTPPFQLSEDPELPPIVGIPVPVDDDGTINLPHVDEVYVEGSSLGEVKKRIRRMYLDRGILIEKENPRVIVTLIKRRTTRVLVVRNESGGVEGVTKRGSGEVLYLRGYENDVLHALNQTGGLPGLDAKNEIYIYRGLFNDAVEADAMITALKNSGSGNPCLCNPCRTPEPPIVTKIPIRFHPSAPPNFTQEDIILKEGDIVMIKSRDEETFFTGGLLGGAEIPLPRDKDLDVIGAVALAGGGFGNPGSPLMAVSQAAGSAQGGGQGGGVNNNGGICPPSELIVIRELPCDQQIAMKIDLNRAVVDKSHRILVKPNDVLILRYSPHEEVSNALLSLVRFNFLFNGFSGNRF